MTNRPVKPTSFPSLLATTAAVLVAVLLVAGLRSYRDWRAIRDRESAIEDEIALTEGRIDQLGHRIEQLKSDPAMLETMVREELGLVRPEDVVILLPEALPGESPSPPPEQQDP